MSLDFSWDGTNASVYGFTVHNVNKDILQEESRTFVDPPNYQGAIQLSKKFGSRIVEVEGRIAGTSYSNLVTSILPAFSAFLYKSSDVQLIFSDQTDRYFNAQVKKIKVKKEVSSWKILDIEFICADPFAYDTTADTDTKSTITTKGYTWDITNSGHYTAYPEITVTFNQSQTHIYIANNSVSGCRFDISKAFVNTNVLVLDSRTLNVTLGGAYSPAGFGDGGNSKAEFIVLDTGVNELEISTDDATLNVDVKVEFNKPYLF
jgi:predicted phage tail component-like protein